jgi:hypothetical protein
VIWHAPKEHFVTTPYTTSFTRRRSGTTTYTWMTVVIDGQPYGAGDPWPAVRWPQAEIATVVARLTVEIAAAKLLISAGRTPTDADLVALRARIGTARGHAEAAEIPDPPVPTAYQSALFDAGMLPPPSRALPTRRPCLPHRAIRDALAPYVDLAQLPRLAQQGDDVRQALRDAAPPEADHLLRVLAALLHPTDRPQIRSPVDAATLLMVEMGHLDQEHFRTILLDTKNRVLAMPTVYQGSVNAAMVRISEVFKAAIQQNAPALIICHNHPSGDPTPSPEDVAVTRKIIEAGALLDIDVLDHLVIGHGRFVSLRERGVAFAA